jgi:type I restriction enzyme S subunit
MEGRAPYLAPDIWSLFPDRLDDEGRPEGWTTGKIYEIGQIICGKTPSTSVRQYYGNDVPFVTIPDMHGKIFMLNTSKSLSLLGASSQRNKTLPPGAICVSCIATPGLVALTTTQSQTNQQINSVIPKNIEERFYWFWVLRDLGEDIRQGGSGGSVISNLSTGRFMEFAVLFAPARAREAYAATAGPLFARILHNETESQTLATTRDLLLPKLMSGEVRVKHAEEVVVEAT